VTSGRPILYRGERVGRGGRVFTMLKFRTLKDDAEERLGPYLGEELVRRTEDEFTTLGKWLKATQLDELPQFLNVLRGDMSLVGPRPHALKHNQQYAASIQDLMRRHYVKPGITGLAQINGARGETRSVGDMQKRVSYDLQYIQNWSLWLDLKIIALTVVRGFYNNQP
jgi:lipopolysaccharide/colanic/teichoic acid biosynthesis glycosyltransferase